jgi:hypothetical protein
MNLNPKITFILYLALPAMRQAASWLRNKDANSTGVDDYAAQILDSSSQFLEDVLTSPETPSPAAEKITATIEAYNAEIEAQAEAKAAEAVEVKPASKPIAKKK